MKRAGRVLYTGRPAVVWRVYFVTWEGEGSRASRLVRRRTLQPAKGPGTLNLPIPALRLQRLDRFPAGGRAGGPGVSGGKPLASRASLLRFHCLAEAAL